MLEKYPPQTWNCQEWSNFISLQSKQCRWAFFHIIVCLLGFWHHENMFIASCVWQGTLLMWSVKINCAIQLVWEIGQESFQKVTYKMAQGGMMEDCSHTFPSGFPVLCGEACFSCVLPSPSTCRKKKLVKTKQNAVSYLKSSFLWILLPCTRVYSTSAGL